MAITSNSNFNSINEKNLETLKNNTLGYEVPNNWVTPVGLTGSLPSTKKDTVNPLSFDPSKMDIKSSYSSSALNLNGSTYAPAIDMGGMTVKSPEDSRIIGAGSNYVELEEVNKLKPKVPYDFRIDDAYIVNIPTGNFTMDDPDMQGSPALLNPNAIIRFSHIANMNHQQHIFDYEGNYDFRGRSIQQPISADSEEGKKILAERNKSIMLPKGNTDENGMLYELEEDRTMKEWKDPKTNEIIKIFCGI